MTTHRDWSLRMIHEFMKQAAITLAELDEKDPFSPIKEGKNGRDIETWQAYIHSVRRITAVLIPFHEMMNSQPTGRPTADIMDAILDVADELRSVHKEPSSKLIEVDA